MHLISVGFLYGNVSLQPNSYRFWYRRLAREQQEHRILNIPNLATYNGMISSSTPAGHFPVLSKNWDVNEVKALFKLIDCKINSYSASARNIIDRDTSPSGHWDQKQAFYATFTPDGPIPKIADIRRSIHEILRKRAESVAFVKRSVEEVTGVNIALDDAAQKIRYPKGPHEAAAQEFDDLVALYAELKRLYERLKFAQGDMRAAKIVNEKRRKECEEWLRMLDAMEQMKRSA
jgi:hypothetical protein